MLTLDSMATSNTFCFIDLPALLSEANVWRFREAFPEHKEIIDKYWERKRSINVDKVLSRDAGELLKIIEQCKNLKELKFTRPQKSSKKFKQLPAAIIRHCHAVEVLDMPGIQLSDEDLSSLSSLVSLKSLNINCGSVINITKLLDRLFINNQQLNELRIQNLRKVPFRLSFKNLSKSITKLEIDAFDLDNLGDLFDHIDTWRLEELRLYWVTLSNELTMKLGNQTTLKIIHLSIDARTPVIVRLLSNNPNLEYVRTNLFEMDESSSAIYLRSLPKTVNELLIDGNIDCNVLTECFTTWKLLSLNLSGFSGSLTNFVAAIPLLENLSFECSTVGPTGLISIQQLKQLKTLHLSYLTIDFNDALIEIMNSCLKLENLELEDVSFLLSQDLLNAIANLPVLKEIIFKVNIQQTAYTNFIQNLSKRKTLKMARFDYCNGFNNDLAQTLIRECQSLTHLWYMPLCIPLTPDFVHETVRELNEQTNRREALYLTIPLKVDMTAEDLHPKLELTTYSNRDSFPNIYSLN